MAYSRAAQTEETARLLEAVAKELASLQARGIKPKLRPGVTGPKVTLMGLAIARVAKRHRRDFRAVYSAVWRDRTRRIRADEQARSVAQ